MIRKALAAFLLEREEVDHHVRFIETDGNRDIALMDNTEGHGGIRCSTADLLDIGNTQDDEHPTVIVLITGTLVGIADIRHEVIRDIELLFEFALVFFGGASHLYPAIGLPLCELGQSALGVPVSLHFANPFFVCEMVLAAKGLAALLAIPRLYEL